MRSNVFFNANTHMLESHASWLRTECIRCDAVLCSYFIGNMKIYIAGNQPMQPKAFCFLCVILWFWNCNRHVRDNAFLSSNKIILHKNHEVIRTCLWLNLQNSTMKKKIWWIFMYKMSTRKYQLTRYLIRFFLSSFSGKSFECVGTKMCPCGRMSWSCLVLLYNNDRTLITQKMLAREKKCSEVSQNHSSLNKSQISSGRHCLIY